MAEDPADWLEVGAQALLVTSRGHTVYSLERATIEKLTPRDAVLSGGHRFRRDSMTGDGRLVRRSRDAWGSDTFLVPPAHPLAREALRCEHLNNATARMRAAIDTLERAARSGQWGEEVTDEQVGALTAAWERLRAARRRYLPAAPAAAGSGDEDHDDEHHQQPEDRVDEQP